MAIVTAAEPIPVITGVPKETPDDPVATEEVEEEEVEDFIEDEFALMVLKVMGVVVVVFSIIEFGVGGSAFSAFQNVKLGGWWIGLLSIPAGIGAVFANKRLYVMGTAVLAVLAAVLSFISTVLDGYGATTLHKMVTCSGGYTVYAGKRSGAAAAQNCLIDFVTSTAFSYSSYTARGIPCSCVTDSGDCYNYRLSYPSTYVDTCNDILTSYPKRVDASAVFSAFLLILTIGLSTVAITILTCPTGYIGGAAKTEAVPNNTIVPPDNGLVGVNGNTDAV